MTKKHRFNTAAKTVALATVLYYYDMLDRLLKHGAEPLFDVYFKVHADIKPTPKHIASFLSVYFNSVFIADDVEISGCSKTVIMCGGLMLKTAYYAQPKQDKLQLFYREKIEEAQRAIKAETYGE